MTTPLTAQKSVMPADMAPPAAPINTSPPPATIEQTLQQMDARLARIDKQTAPKKKDPHDKANKGMVAAAFALAGFKLGGLLFWKAGFLVADHPRAFKREGMVGVKDLWMTMLTLFKDKTSEQLTTMYKWSGIGLAGGTFIGAGGGAILGWMRGDRLDSASDLFLHPIESMRKIFGPPPPPEVPDLVIPALHQSVATPTLTAHAPAQTQQPKVKVHHVSAAAAISPAPLPDLGQAVG